MPETEPIPLSDEDRAILALECATVAGHTCKIVALGGSGIEVEALRERIGSRLPAVPELTRKLGGTAEEPAWVAAAGFDLADHVRASPIGPEPSSESVLVEVARLFEQRLDRDRPLWAIDVVPRPAGGSVLIWRIHHALADGTASMRFARELLWDEATAPPPTAPHGPRPHPDHERRRAHLAAFIEREFASSLHRSPFDGRIGASRRVALAAAPLRELHDAARRLASATLNDAVLSLVAGSLRRWIEQHHGPLGDIRARVPVSLHHEGDDAGNRDSFFSVRLPLGIADPIERLRVVERETAIRKEAGDAKRIETDLAAIGQRSRRLAALVERIESSPREFAVSVSNVPGPRQPVSVLGAPVEELHSIAEIGLRHGLRITAVSLADRLFFGFNADPVLVDRVEAMAAGIEAEAEALINAG